MHGVRGVFADGQTFAHLIEALDGILRRLGRTARSWRTDRMATVVYPGTDRLRPEAAAAAKHYGVTVAVCPANRPQRKGVVEKAIDDVTQALPLRVVGKASGSQCAVDVCGAGAVARGQR